ncbi:hypothetical protein [Lysobacter enzymogenes]|uniref:hypothetical protein n=1 Tax=Lysobacter enzymogenes TaxID=69 RepID=UPI00099B2B0C|nr:hypothetical protein [Lysobacter enzymogenes]UZW60138.1 hypothetical protein BV903_023160 [Lysobacter enzymogenes]
MLCLGLLAGHAAGAAEGGDFCDNANALNALPYDPAGGGCEVDMFKDRPGPLDPAGSLRVHDLPWASLQRPPATAAPVDLSVQIGEIGFVDGEVLIEWSFESIKTGERRVLALSLWRDIEPKAGQPAPTRVLAQWYSPAQPDWSLVDPRSALAPAQATSVVDLSPGRRLSQFRLAFDGRQVAVSIQNGLIAHTFAPPGSGWRPVRLRNAILSERPLPGGSGVRLLWPQELFVP